MPAITVRCVAMGLEGDIESCNETPDWVKKIDSTATPSTWIISDYSNSNVRAMQQPQQPQQQQQQQQCSSCGSSSFWKVFLRIYLIIIIIIITVLIFTVLQ